MDRRRVRLASVLLAIDRATLGLVGWLPDDQDPLTEAPGARATAGHHGR